MSSIDFVWSNQIHDKTVQKHTYAYAQKHEIKMETNLPLTNFHKETSELHCAVRLDVAIMMADNGKPIRKPCEQVSERNSSFL